MKHRAVIEVVTNSIEEEQFILNRFPDAVWVALKEEKTLFYIPYYQYNSVKKSVEEWNKKNEKE